MTPRHLLGEAVFDIAFPSEEEAFAQHLELGSYVRERLLAVVDEVFDEVAGGGLIYRFDSIEIDLGDLPLDDYQEEMVWRLRERLRTHLLTRLPTWQAEPTPGVRAISQPRLALEQIEYFLITGRLPWNSGHEEEGTLEPWAWEVLRATGAEFLEFLESRSRAGEGVTRRLIAQFSDALLLEIAGRLAPAQSSLFTALIAELGRAGAAHKLSSARARELRQNVWSALLEILLRNGGTLSATGLIATLLERMARRAGGRAPRMERARGGETKTALESFAAGIDAMLAPGAAPSALPSKAWGDAGTLEAALLNGSDGEIESAWQDAPRLHPNALRETLRRHGASARVRTRLAGILPDALLRETVDHLEPEGSGFVADVIGQAGLSRALPDVVSGGDQVGHRQRLWACTLGYLAVERGAAFSGKAYLDSLVRQSAAHTALSRREVVARLRQALAPDEVSGTPPAELDRLLRELADATLSTASVGELRSRERMRGYDLLDQLRDGLRGRLEADADLSATVTELAEFHPWAWSQLHRELRARVFPGVSLGAGLAPETLRRLIAGHLDYRGLSGRDGGVEHLAAIERRAARAADRARFYRQILLGLISNLPGDLVPEHRSMSKAEAEANWLVIEEPTRLGKDKSVDKPERRTAPAVSHVMAGWKKETLERLADRLPGAPHRRIRLSQRNAGSRAALEPGRRVHGDLSLSIRPSENLAFFERGLSKPVSPSTGPDQTGFKPLLAGSRGAGSEIDEAEKFVTALEERAAVWQAHAACDLGMTPMPPRDASADDLAVTAMAAESEPPVTIPDSSSLVTMLKRGAVAGTEQTAALSRDIQALLEAEPDHLEALLAELRRHGVALERLVAAQPESQLTRLLFRLRGAEHHEIQVCADTLAGACGFSDPGVEPTSLRDAKWRFILGEWLGQGLLFDRHAFARQFTHFLAEQAGWPDERRFRYLLSQQLGHELSHTPLSSPASEITGSPDVSSGHQAPEQADQEDLISLSIPGRMPERTRDPDQEAVTGAQGSDHAEVGDARMLLDSLRAAATAQTVDRRETGQQPGQRPSAREALHHQREIILALRAALEDRDAVPVRPVKAAREPAEERGEDIYIGNAGLVLAAPYLPRLFAMLDLLDGPTFRDAAAAERAVRLSQYLVDGEESVDEFKLVLNKILCGLATDTPIEREAGFSEREKEAAEGLLRGMIDNWKGVGHTSLAGLRETFLRREGRLRLKDGAWNLLVAPKPFDMLLDTLPWSIAVIRHRWMDRVIHVVWR